MTNDTLAKLAQSIVADGRRDREVLRRRWRAPSWRDEVERIARTLERYPLLVPAVEKTIADELRRLGEAVDVPPSGDDPSNTQTPEATADADRQDTTLPDV